MGSDERLVHVHKNLICAKSPFFQACLNSVSGFREASENVVILPDDDLEAFAQVLKWAYPSTVTTPAITDNDPAQSLTAVNLLLNTYMLADKLCMEDLQNKLLDAICDWHTVRRTSVVFINRLIDRGPPDCRLKDVLIQQSAFDLRKEGRGPHREIFDLGPVQSFLRSGSEEAYQVIVALASLRDDSIDPSSRKGCYWHNHVLTPVCQVSVGQASDMVEASPSAATTSSPLKKRARRFRYEG